jgi:hypothetical protein
MRTTLKRGMGRGAAVNGNGRAVLPPTTVSPVTLYRQPPPPRRSRWRLAGAVASWLVVALLTLATGLAGGVYLYAHEAVHDVQAHTPAVKIAQKRLDVPTAGKPATALVIGYDRRYFNDSGEYSAINLQPGYQELNGYQALAFVRYRHTDSDIYRLARQQAFVKAFKDQVHSAYKPLKLLGLVKEITRNVEVGVGGGKALDLDTVLSYAFFAYDLPPGHFFQSNIEGLEENSSFDIFAPEERMREAVRRFASPDVASPEKATQVVLGGRPKSAAPAPRDTYVTVLNGNGVEGSATLAGGLLHERGYSITTPSSGTANAPSYDYFETKIYFDPAQRGAKAAARKVANLFGSADVARVPPAVEALGNNAMIVVVVGKTFHGSLAAAPVDQTPVKQPPSIAPGTDASLQLLRDRAKKVPFPLMVPTVIERTSVIDREQPVRLYRIDPDREHRALRLVFRTGASEYWGVQETDWTEAPILSERNVTRRVKGRRYELHYSGPKLHMIVLRTRHATYWVTNTLRDSLSNETMLAIAKGLKPIASLK